MTNDFYAADLVCLRWYIKLWYSDCVFQRQAKGFITPQGAAYFTMSAGAGSLVDKDVSGTVQFVAVELMLE